MKAWSGIAAASVLALAMGMAGAPVLAAQEPPAAEQSQASRALADIVSDYEAWARSIDPITAGFEGDREALSRLPDNSRQAELARRGPLGEFRDRLAAVDMAGLSAEERLNHSLLSRSVALDLERIELDGGRLAFVVVEDFPDALGDPHRTVPCSAFGSPHR